MRTETVAVVETYNYMDYICPHCGCIKEFLVPTLGTLNIICQCSRSFSIFGYYMIPETDSRFEEIKNKFN